MIDSTIYFRPAPLLLLSVDDRFPGKNSADIIGVHGWTKWLNILYIYICTGISSTGYGKPAIFYTISRTFSVVRRFFRYFLFKQHRWSLTLRRSRVGFSSERREKDSVGNLKKFLLSLWKRKEISSKKRRERISRNNCARSPESKLLAPLESPPPAKPLKPWSSRAKKPFE